MKLSKTLYDFMLVFKDLLDEHKFDEFFTRAYQTFTITPYVTLCKFVYDKYPQCLYYMKSIPWRFFQGRKFERFVIPDNIQIIEIQAFLNTSIKELVIPKKLEEIQKGAFRDSDIDKIIFKGTLKEWNARWASIQWYSYGNDAIDRNNNVICTEE